MNDIVKTVHDTHSQLKTIWSELLQPCPHAVALLLPEVDENGTSNCPICELQRDRTLLLTLVEEAFKELGSLREKLHSSVKLGNVEQTHRHPEAG